MMIHHHLQSHDGHRDLGSRYGLLVLVGLLYATMTILGVLFEEKLLTEDLGRELTGRETTDVEDDLLEVMSQGLQRDLSELENGELFKGKDSSSVNTQDLSAKIMTEQEEISLYENTVDWASLDDTKKYFFSDDTTNDDDEDDNEDDDDEDGSNAIWKEKVQSLVLNGGGNSERDGDKLPFSSKNPIIVLNLPNSGELASYCYFECAGANIGRHWTDDSGAGDKLPIGKCIHQSIEEQAKTGKAKISIDQCGSFDVWMSLQYVETPNPQKLFPDCFEPSLFPGALDALYKAFPRATVLMVTRSPKDWHDTLAHDVKHQWTMWCNANHNHNFPNIDDSPLKITWTFTYGIRVSLSSLLRVIRIGS